MAEPTIFDLVSLRGQTAVVTGAGSGIGRVCSLRLGQLGASIVAADLDVAAAEQTAQRVRSEGASASVIGLDVRSESQCDAVADHAMEAFGRIDILINAAGIFPPAPFFEMTVDQWDAVLNINTRGTFLMSRSCARHMQGGTIVNLASKSAYSPTIGMTHYGASKGAVVMLTKNLALELSDRTVAKIRQNLFWAFVYNVAGIPLAAFGFLSPVVAGAAMALSSVSVMSNALLLRRWRPGRGSE